MRTMPRATAALLVSLAIAACDGCGPNGPDCTQPADCDDSNPCTDDACSPQGQCTHAHNAAPCDDGVFCNGADTCGGGSCQHAGDPCAGGPECAGTCNEIAGNCFDTPGSACTDTALTDCLDAACDGSGTCDQAYGPEASGTTCNDDLFCNGSDTCDAIGGCTTHAGDPCSGLTCDEGANICVGLWPHFVSVTVGDRHACGLTANGAAYCWGDDGVGQLGNGGTSAATQSPSPVDTTTISGNKAFTQLTAGRYHTCGLTADGVAYCWGWDSWGTLGNGGTGVNTQSPSPVDTTPIAGNKTFVRLTSGMAHVCGLTAGGVAYCWGYDSDGQLGNGGTSLDVQSPSPVDTTPITGNTAFVQLEAGERHTCGLTAGGVAYCWGRDDAGQLGDGGASVSVQSPSAVDTTTLAGNTAFVELSAGGFHACGRTADGVTYCWGSGTSGQLGNGGSANVQSPSPVDTTGISGNKVFVRLTAGRGHTCGVTADGLAYCWGLDATGQLGDGGASANALVPSPVDTAPLAGGAAFAWLDAGEVTTCGLTVDGFAYCWGDDTYGQLGNGGLAAGTQSPAAVDMSPVVAGPQTFLQVSGGGFHSCGFTPTGQAYCWGSDFYGQLGNGTGGSSQAPAAVDTSTVTGEATFVLVAGGEGRTCGLTASHAAYCWGFDGFGALGNGNTIGDTQSPSPVDTSTMTGNTAFAELAMGRSHTCGLTVTGNVYCWGSDSYGQLGDGGGSAATQSPSPLDTSTITGNRAFIHITAGLYHTCGITADGRSHCWGHDGVGELGNGGGSADEQSPSAVDTSTIAGNTAFVHMTAGWDQTCASTAAGGAYCWGYDSVGQLGNGGGSLDEQSPSAIDTSTMPGNEVFARFAGGGDHMCGISVDGAAFCWGADNQGQLGNGGASTNTQSPSAVDVTSILGNRAFTGVTGGFYHSCGVAADGAGLCWGNDLDGQLGNGGTGVSTQSPTAVDVSGI